MSNCAKICRPKKKEPKKKWICLNIERGVKLSAYNISHIFLTEQPEFIHQVPWKKSSQAWAWNLFAHMCVYVLRITKEQAGKLAFHSHISCQQDNNGNKVMAILKSQARSQTEAPCRMLYVWLCIHPLMHSGSLWAHQSEINIYTTRNLRWVPAWLMSFRGVHAMRLTEKKWHFT